MLLCIQVLFAYSYYYVNKLCHREHQIFGTIGKILYDGYRAISLVTLRCNLHPKHVNILIYYSTIDQVN